METRNTQQFRQFRSKQYALGNFPSAKYKPKNKKFSIFDINTQNIILPLSYSFNELLFKLNQNFIENFDENKKIKPALISNYLLKPLMQKFDFHFKEVTFNTVDDSLLIDENLNFDFYVFELKPFFKLKYKNPFLFNCFIALIDKLNLPIIENEDIYEFHNEELLDYYTDYYSDIHGNINLENVKIELAKIKEKLKGLNIKFNQKQILINLKKYKPRNKTYLKLKKLFLLGFDLDMSFLNYQIDNDNDEYLELYKRVFFQWNTNNQLNKLINQNIQDAYNYKELQNPISYFYEVDYDKFEYVNTKKAIQKFEKFTKQYSKIIDEI